MKVLVLGDTHGRTAWEKIVANESFDKIIFIGDYVDTHEDITPLQQKLNLENILKYVRENKDKVVMLLGNHDFHYLRYSMEEYSRYQSVMQYDFQQLIQGGIDEGLITVAHQHEQFLFTHAGVTKTWCEYASIDMDNIVESINERFITQPSFFRFTMGKTYSRYGDDITQPPIWVRPKSLMMDKVPGYIHIVGHTTVKRISSKEDYEGIRLIDTLGESGEFLVIENGEETIKSIKDYESN